MIQNRTRNKEPIVYHEVLTKSQKIETRKRSDPQKPSDKAVQGLQNETKDLLLISKVYISKIYLLCLLICKPPPINAWYLSFYHNILKSFFCFM